MTTVSWQFFCEKRALWLNRIAILFAAIIALVGLSIILGVKVYQHSRSVALIHEKISEFQTQNDHRLNLLISKRESFIQKQNQKSWKSTKQLFVYDNEIENLRCRHQTMQLLKLKLSIPNR